MEMGCETEQRVEPGMGLYADNARDDEVWGLDRLKPKMRNALEGDGGSGNHFCPTSF
jgi:hypothetical protein